MTSLPQLDLAGAVANRDVDRRQLERDAAPRIRIVDAKPHCVDGVDVEFRRRAPSCGGCWKVTGPVGRTRDVNMSVMNIDRVERERPQDRRTGNRYGHALRGEERLRGSSNGAQLNAGERDAQREQVVLERVRLESELIPFADRAHDPFERVAPHDGRVHGDRGGHREEHKRGADSDQPCRPSHAQPNDNPRLPDSSPSCAMRASSARANRVASSSVAPLAISASRSRSSVSRLACS